MKIPYRIRRIYESALFQGAAFPRGYFEGWYFKLTTPNPDPADSHSFAIIPGISVSKTGNRHAFIQSIDGRTGVTRYTEYPIDAFRFSRDSFSIRIGESHFSKSGMELHVRDGDHHIEGAVTFRDTTDIPRSITAPSIMGWYRYVPGMECYHGVVSVDHRLEGSLITEGGKIDFSGGSGYIEKDYGTSFPSSWIWMQTNHFSGPGTSFMLSIARIPWIGKSFTGFLGFLKTPERFHRFATYNGAKIRHIGLTRDEVTIVVETRNNRRLEVRAIKGKPGGLKAPVQGAMNREIAESVSTVIEISMDGDSLFRDTGYAGGLEIVGNIDELLDGVVP